MTVPTLADLRRQFYSPSTGQTVTDAEYTQLAALYAQGVTLPGLVGGGGQGEVNLRASTTSDWTRKILTTDVNAPDSALTIEHGQWTSRVIGGSGTQSNRREAWIIPDFPSCRNQRVKSRFASHPPADGTIEHVLGLRFSQDATKMRQVTVWDFGFGLLLCGVWESNLDGSGFVSPQAAQADREAFTGGSRTTSVVTLTGLAAGANTRWSVGDLIQVDAADNTYDGFFVITAVTSTTLTYTQAAADDASSGAGFISLGGRVGGGTGLLRTPNFSATGLNASRTGGFTVVTGLTAGHPFQVGDRVVTSGFVDATYNAARLYVTAVTSTTITLAQPGVADDADAGGSGVVTKASPYNVEARVIGNLCQARVWPDFGGNFNGANVGPSIVGPPPWESPWAMTWDLSTVAGTVPTEGVVTIGAGHHSTNSPVRHDNIEASPVYGYNF
jgi:hypothetical protein